MPARLIARIAIFVALVCALGFALAAVPNVELMTLGAFVAGAALGSRAGAVVGGTAMAIYSGLNPYGMAPPQVYAAQVVGFFLIGAAGGLVRRRGSAPGGGKGPVTAALSALAGGVAGATLTLAYDVLTNLGTAWAMGSLANPWPIVAGGVAFGAWHLAVNAVLFAVCAPPLLAALRRREVLAS